MFKLKRTWPVVITIGFFLFLTATCASSRKPSGNANPSATIWGSQEILRQSLEELQRISDGIFDSTQQIYSSRSLETQLRLDSTKINNFLIRQLLANLNTKVMKWKKAFEYGIYFETPSENAIFQRRNDKADIFYHVINIGSEESIQIRLTRLEDHTVLFSSHRLEGNIKDIPVGMYRLSAYTGERGIAITIGVGDVYVVAGQSNALSPAQKHPPYFSVTGFVSVNNLYGYPLLDKNQFVIPTPKSPITSNICWLYCGDLLYQRYFVPISFINIAAGSTNTNQWNPKSEYLASQFDAILKERAVRAVLWQQGESDYYEKISEETAYNNMKELILYTRKLQPSLPWFVALNSMKTALPKNDISIRRAQKALIDSGLALLGPDTDTLRENPEWMEASGAEFVGEGLKHHGELWFEVLSKYLDSKK